MERRTYVPLSPGRRGRATQLAVTKGMSGADDSWYRFSMRFMGDVGTRVAQFAGSSLVSLVDSVSSPSSDIKSRKTPGSPPNSPSLSCMTYQLDVRGKRYGDCICGEPRFKHSKTALLASLSKPSSSTLMSQPFVKTSMTLRTQQVEAKPDRTTNGNNNIPKVREETLKKTTSVKPPPPALPIKSIGLPARVLSGVIKTSSSTTSTKKSTATEKQSTNSDATMQKGSPVSNKPRKNFVRASARLMFSSSSKDSTRKQSDFAPCTQYELDMTGKNFGDCICGRPRQDHSAEALKKAKSSAPVRAAPPNLVLHAPGSAPPPFVPLGDAGKDSSPADEWKPKLHASGTTAAPKWVPPKPQLKTHNVDLAKYEKMLKCGLPRGAIENAMVRDGVDPGLLNFEASSTSTSDSSQPLNNTDESDKATIETSQSSTSSSNTHLQPMASNRLSSKSFRPRISGSHLNAIKAAISGGRTSNHHPPLPDSVDVSNQQPLSNPFMLNPVPPKKQSFKSSSSRKSSGKQNPTANVSMFGLSSFLTPPPDFANTVMSYFNIGSSPSSETMESSNPLFARQPSPWENDHTHA